MKSEVGKIKGVPYALRRDKLCNVLAVESKHIAWFLFICEDYIGNFETKREALQELDKQIENYI